MEAGGYVSKTSDEPTVVSYKAEENSQLCGTRWESLPSTTAVHLE